jgi:hypothetical protein
MSLRLVYANRSREAFNSAMSVPVPEGHIDVSLAKAGASLTPPPTNVAVAPAVVGCLIARG